MASTSTFRSSLGEPFLVISNDAFIQGTETGDEDVQLQTIQQAQQMIDVWEAQASSSMNTTVLLADFEGEPLKSKAAGVSTCHMLTSLFLFWFTQVKTWAGVASF